MTLKLAPFRSDPIYVVVKPTRGSDPAAAEGAEMVFDVNARGPHLIVINVTSMTKADYHNHKLVVFQAADESIVIDSIAPEFSEFAFETFPELPGIPGA
jgi:hypothetical protein